MDTNNAEYKKGYDEAIEYIKELLNQGTSGKGPQEELDPDDEPFESTWILYRFILLLEEYK